MENALHFRIADLTVALMSDDPGLRLGSLSTLKQFQVEDSVADVTVRAAWADLREPAPKNRIFDSGALWQLYQRDTNFLFHFTSPAFGPHPYKQACFHSDFTSGDILLHRPYFDSGRTADPMEYPLDELMFVNLLSLGRGVEVHACGIQDEDGRGYLFLGESGAGKSTMGRLWEKTGRVQILSDDRIILRRLDGKIWMYGTPWHGEAELSCAARAPLTHTFFLRKGSENGLVPLRSAQSVARLMACCFVPFYNAAGLDYSLTFFEQVTEDVPCCELSVVPDERVVEYVRRMVLRNA